MIVTLSPMLEMIFQVYVPIAAGVLTGITVGHILSRFSNGPTPIGDLHSRVPLTLGRFLFWIGIPISIIGFMRQADLSANLYLAPLVAWMAILLGWLLSYLWIRRNYSNWPLRTQGSFTLASMLGNTGYIGYPVVLLLPQLGVDAFGWALFYDTLGTLLGSFGLGAVLASNWSGQEAHQPRSPWWAKLQEIISNPVILAFFLGLGMKAITLPNWMEVSLYRLAWGMVVLSLVLMGLRLQQLDSWRLLGPASVVVTIKMLMLPLAIGIGLTALGIDGPPRLVMILLAGMPSAFATLVLAENYNLDRDLSVTCVGLSSVSLLLTMPLWLWCFSGGCT
jgi:predicted permease